jgi:4-amino-4-deoxy-L-arabinose transferase-like glycosyltransferase
MNKPFHLKKLLTIEILCWAIFILFLLMIVLVRYRLQNIPLERDEGEYAYFGQLLLQGIPPYLLAYNLKLPGMYAAYALIMAVLGQSIEGIHLGFLIVNLFSAILLFFMTKRLFGFVAAIVSAISYSILSISPSVLGAHAHATHFVVAMALPGLLLLLKATETGKRKYFFWGGFFFGLAFLMKQPGIFFFLFGIYYLLWFNFNQRFALRSNLVLPLTTYTFGALLPFAGTCLALSFAGVFNKFWFWTFQYASQYSSQEPLQAVFKIFTDQLIQVAYPFQSIWYFAILGLVCLYIDVKAKKHIAFVAALFAVSIISVCPGFIFRKHYFVTALPVISILTGCGINSVYEFMRDRKRLSFISITPIIIFSSLLLYAVYQQRNYLFISTPVEISRQYYGANPFIESIEVANYIKANSSTSDTIAVLGSEPQIYFYAQRHSATGYIYTYSLMERQPFALRMQQEMIQEIESKRPLFIIFVNISSSWLRRSESETTILEWSDKYIREHYNIVGVVEIISADKTNYYWDAQVHNISLRSSDYLAIYKRNN